MELVLGVAQGEEVCQELTVAVLASVAVAAAVPLQDSPGELETLPTELSLAAIELV